MLGHPSTARSGSRVRRREILRTPIGMILLLLTMSPQLACSKGDDSSSPDAQDQIQFVEEAKRGTFVDNGDGTFTLTLLEVEPIITVLSDQQEVSEDAAAMVEVTAPMAGVIDGFDWDEEITPTAAIVIGDPLVPANQNTLIVELSNLVYDAATATLTCTARPIESYVGSGLASYLPENDASLPGAFGQVSIVLIDLCKRIHINCYKYYGCCDQPSVTHPCGALWVAGEWQWSYFKCMPKDDNICKKKFPKCCNRDCYVDCSSCPKTP